MPDERRVIEDALADLNARMKPMDELRREYEAKLRKIKDRPEHLCRYCHLIFKSDESWGVCPQCNSCAGSSKHQVVAHCRYPSDCMLKYEDYSIAETCGGCAEVAQGMWEKIVRENTIHASVEEWSPSRRFKDRVASDTLETQ